MQKKIGIVGTYGRVDRCAFMNTDDLLNKVGANTGNLLFQYAVFNSINKEKIVIGCDIPWDIETIKSNCRVIVIPSSNFIRENFDFSNFVDLLEKTKLPLVFLGLGAQANDYNQKDFNFHTSIHKLIRLVKERCQIAGLRGEFTANLLEKFGVKNTEIIGCPTNFLNFDTSLVKKLENKWKNDIDSFVATGDEPWPNDLKKRDAERRMVSWVHKGNAIFLQQSVAPFIKYVRQNNPYQNSDVPEHHEKSLRQSIAPFMTQAEFKTFIATRLRVYYSVDQWLEDMARFDFSIGLRLHGNMAAWQSGTPAIWIYHDSRTRELTETMALPNLSHHEFLKFKTITQLKESIDPLFDKYNKRRILLNNRYLNILDTEQLIKEQ
jgi:hypothetical protein